MQYINYFSWLERQIVVLNVVGSNPTGYPPKVLEIIEFQGLLLYVSTIRPHKGRYQTVSRHTETRKAGPGSPGPA